MKYATNLAFILTSHEVKVVTGLYAFIKQIFFNLISFFPFILFSLSLSLSLNSYWGYSLLFSSSSISSFSLSSSEGLGTIF